MAKALLIALSIMTVFHQSARAADTLYSRCGGGTKCVRMILDVNTNGIRTIVTEDVVNQSSITSAVYVRDGASASGNIVSVTGANGRWWYIPFDSTIAPITCCATGGSFSASHSCACKKEHPNDPTPSGSCSWHDFSDGVGDCTSTDCTGCCDEETVLASNGGLPFSIHSSGVYLKAQNITYNGTQY